MEHISEIMASGKSRIAQIVAVGKKIRKWYVQHGFIYTNFGLVHKDWISEGISQGWISPSGPRYPNIYSLVVKTQTTTRVKRTGRDVDEFEKTQYDLSPSSAWFSFLETKRAAFLEQNKERLAEMRELMFRKS